MLAKELVAASTEPLILSLLSEGESYGYALIQEVKRLSGDKIEWTDGMLYPVLHRMEREGWIESRWGEAENGRKRKYYSLKKDGKKALQTQREQWVTVSNEETDRSRLHHGAINGPGAARSSLAPVVFSCPRKCLRTHRAGGKSCFGSQT